MTVRTYIAKNSNKKGKFSRIEMDEKGNPITPAADRAEAQPAQGKSPNASPPNKRGKPSQPATER